MPKSTLVVVATLLVVTTAAGGTLSTNAASSSNEAPLADAGLDQDVTRGATVLLDGTGSRDPDGRIERYDWSIQTPSGNTVTPDCADCGRTRFAPTETGRYHVTLTVTDDDGTTSSDTLYVDVEPGTPPTMSLSGPEQPTEGSTATYTADLTAGSVALDYVVWRVDGVVIANHSLSPDQGTDAATKQFPTHGERSVTATVYDADGQSNAASLSVTVQRETEPPVQSPKSNPSIADRNSPNVTGEKLVTGTKPLRGQYTVQLDASASAVASVEWRDAAGHIGSGRSLTRTWEPGDHQLYAVVTYSDGSENVATFESGTTTVTADPRPTVSIGSLDRFGSISGVTTGTDEYENLDTLRLEIDGETVATANSSVKGRHRLDFDRQRTLRFAYDDFEPGTQYSVAVVATDERGQTTRVSRDIVPVKKPEVVRSEFVNGPVDSYHDRIDPSRYVAHHVLEIDLNGVDAEKMDIGFGSEDEFIRNTESIEYKQKNRNNNSGLLFVHSYWAGTKPKMYDINVNIIYSTQNKETDWYIQESDTFQVTSSKPELRLDVVNDGTEEYVTREHGMLVNASGSFDPDGTELKYIWKYGAEPTKPDNTTAKFSAYERAASIVEDGYDLREKRNFDFLNYFVPEIAESTVLGEEPYYANETVRVRVETEPYHFSKQTYYQDFSLGIGVANSSASVVEWKAVEASQSEHSASTEDAYQYVGVLEIPVTELSPQSPTVTIYNEENVRKEVQVELPEASVFYEDGEYWTNATVENLTYLVEKPRVRRVTAQTKQWRNQYLEQGYHVEEENSDTRYVLEKRVKVSDAKYETVTKRFQNKGLRDVFLASTDDWYASGTVRKEETRTKEYSRWFDSSSTTSPPKWHDSSLWNGERTGATREVKVESAEYRTQRQYQYEYEVERTGTRTERHCTLRFGCYEETVTYTYTVTRTTTYWATSSYSYDHHFTGNTRKVKIEDAVYETQFEVRYKSRYTELVTYYEVARNELVREAQYDWEARASTMDYSVARKQVSLNSDWRISEESVTTWVLVRQDGVRRFRTSVYVNESDVVETEAVVTGNLTQQYIDPETGDTIEKSEYESSEYTYSSAKSRTEVIEDITSERSSRKWCEMKTACSIENGER